MSKDPEILASVVNGLADLVSIVADDAAREVPGLRGRREVVRAAVARRQAYVAPPD